MTRECSKLPTMPPCNRPLLQTKTNQKSSFLACRLCSILAPAYGWQDGMGPDAMKLFFNQFSVVGRILQTRPWPLSEIQTVTVAHRMVGCFLYTFRLKCEMEGLLIRKDCLVASNNPNGEDEFQENNCKLHSCSTKMPIIEPLRFDFSFLKQTGGDPLLVFYCKTRVIYKSRLKGQERKTKKKN